MSGPGPIALSVVINILSIDAQEPKASKIKPTQAQTNTVASDTFSKPVAITSGSSSNKPRKVQAKQVNSNIIDLDDCVSPFGDGLEKLGGSLETDLAEFAFAAGISELEIGVLGYD